MSEDANRNAGVNAAANSHIHHVRLEDIKQFAPEKLNHLHRGGIRQGASRADVQAQQMLDKIPPSQRAGVDGQTAAARAKDYLSGKDASHIKPHSQGGSSDPSNLKWEDASPNRARGSKPMTRQEQIKLDAKAGLENMSGALQRGLEAAPKGAVVGAVTTLPFSLLRNTLRVVRGEISSEEATLETVKDTAIGGAVGGATAFTVTTVAAACPPVAMVLAAISPALLVAGGAGMVYEFFKILDDHKQQVKQYYESLSQQQLSNLQQIDNELIYEHKKSLTFLAEARELSEEITNRPRKAGIESALNRLQESIAIATSLSAKESDSRLLSNPNQLFLPPNN